MTMNVNESLVELHELLLLDECGHFGTRLVEVVSLKEASINIITILKRYCLLALI